MGEIRLQDSAEGEVVGHVYGIFGLGWGFAVCLLCACGQLCEFSVLLFSLCPFWRVGGGGGLEERESAAKREMGNGNLECFFFFAAAVITTIFGRSAYPVLMI